MKELEKSRGCNSRKRMDAKSFFAVAIFLVMSMPLFAQQVTVTGTVKDHLNEPIIGAAVQEKGRPASGTMTDLDGNFSLNASNTNATLIVTYVGAKTQEVELKGRTNVTVTMGDGNVALDEVVVTALGIKKHAKALGYAVAEVKGDAITGGRDGNAIASLSGRMAGVDISTGSGGPSGSTRVLIRGNSQLSGTNMPLYVVDGVPMDNTQLGSAGKDGGYDMGDGLSSISPDDVESISVLKGASASALYGSRASNGVVLITTKSGKSQQGLGIEFSTNVNAVVLSKGFQDYQRVYGQGTNGAPSILEASARTSTQTAWGAKLDPNTSYYIFNGQKRPYGNVNDNILSFFRTGATYTNTLAVSSSTDKNDFRISVSDMRNTDIVPQSDMYRTTFMLKGGANIGKKMKVEARANYTQEGVDNRPALSDNAKNIGNALIGIAPNFDQKWLADGYKDAEGRYNGWNGNKYNMNPYWILNETENKSSKDRLMGHVQGSYDFLPFLTGQVKVGTDYNKFHFTDFMSKYTDYEPMGRMQETLTEIHETNYEGMLRFNKRFNDMWDISAFAGGNIMKYQYESYYLEAKDQIMMDVKDISKFNIHEKPQHTMLRKQVNSLFGSVNVGYKDFVYLDATIRNDISSTLSKDNRSYVYTSFSGSLLFSEIVDLKSMGVSFGKIRASWAKVGGDTDPYKLFLMYDLMPHSIGGKPAGQIGTMVVPNKDLKPTSTYSYELGLDLRFLQDRVALDFGYYNTSTKNQILPMAISPASGYPHAMINAGEITNSGIEVSLNIIPVRTRDFEWATNINLATNKNKVKELHPDIDSYVLSEARWAGAAIVAEVGQAYGSIIGRKQMKSEDGRLVYDANGLPMYENNLSVLGNGNHDFTLGINNSFRYGNFTLGVLLDMKFGADIYSMSANQAYGKGTSKHTLEGRDAWNASEQARLAANKTPKEWRESGNQKGFFRPGGVTPKLDSKGAIILENGLPVWLDNKLEVNPQEYWGRVTTLSPEPFIYDASFIKLREVTFSYTLPKKLLAKTPFQTVSLNAYGRNLWIIHSKLDNIDPESNYNNGNGQGFEYGSLPSRRTFGFGVNVKF